MKDKQRKMAQRKINKRVRAMNEDIKNDTLWKGRFYARQINANWDRFEDGSGGELRVRLRFTDRNTNQIKDVYLDNYNIDWHLFLEMNNFIVEDCQVWKKNKEN